MRLRRLDDCHVITSKKADREISSLGKTKLSRYLSQGTRIVMN